MGACLVFSGKCPYTKCAKFLALFHIISIEFPQHGSYRAKLIAKNEFLKERVSSAALILLDMGISSALQ
jgi:hypothetical protein